MDSSSHRTPAETDPLTEAQLVELLEAREAEKEAQRRALSRRTTRVLLISGLILLICSVAISFAIEEYRRRNPQPVQQESISSKLHINQSDVSFGKQLFDFVVPPERKPAAPESR